MNKKCREIELLLSAYLENELPKDEYYNVTEHLNGCPGCRGMKERIEGIIGSLRDLQEEVPFFLKNRLYNISEIVEKKSPIKLFYFPKWIAAAVGTIILFLNLFYFTNVFPPMNREMHSFVYSVEKIIARTGGWLDKIKESKELLFFTFFNKKSTGGKDGQRNQNMLNAGEFDKGGKNG
jgi:hypothetical protein